MIVYCFSDQYNTINGCIFFYLSRALLHVSSGYYSHHRVVLQECYTNIKGRTKVECSNWLKGGTEVECYNNVKGRTEIETSTPLNTVYSD